MPFVDSQLYTPAQTSPMNPSTCIPNSLLPIFTCMSNGNTCYIQNPLLTSDSFVHLSKWQFHSFSCSAFRPKIVMLVLTLDLSYPHLPAQEGNTLNRIFWFDHLQPSPTITSLLNHHHPTQKMVIGFYLSLLPPLSSFLSVLNRATQKILLQHQWNLVTPLPRSCNSVPFYSLQPKGPSWVDSPSEFTFYFTVGSSHSSYTGLKASVLEDSTWKVLQHNPSSPPQ